MIGLSLSLCVRDIADGKVDISEVEYINTSIKAIDEAAFENILEAYTHSVWYKSKARSLEIARTLYSQGKIRQPRLEGKRMISLAGLPGPWVKTEEEYQDLLKVQPYV